MADTTTDQIDTSKPSPRKGLLVGLVLLLAAAGGSYMAAGKVLTRAPTTDPGSEHAQESGTRLSSAHGSEAPVSYVPLEPMLVSLANSDRHLRFAAQVETSPEYADEIAHLAPRLIDTLQDYLRAVGADQLAEADALLRLRSQMLRRLQMIAGPDRVSDLLIMEFVLN